jgi:hypothetical protein
MHLPSRFTSLIPRVLRQRMIVALACVILCAASILWPVSHFRNVFAYLRISDAVVGKYSERFYLEMGCSNGRLEVMWRSGTRWQSTRSAVRMWTEPPMDGRELRKIAWPSFFTPWWSPGWCIASPLWVLILICGTFLAASYTTNRLTLQCDGPKCPACGFDVRESKRCCPECGLLYHKENE